MSRKITVKQYKQLYKEVFGSEAGKLVLHDLLNRNYMMSSTQYNDGNENMNFREGKRNVALYILSQVDADLSQLREERTNYKLEVTQDE